MADLPQCRSCGRPYKLMREEGGEQGWWEFACEVCRVGHVYSKPTAQAAGRYRSQLQQHFETERRIRQWEAMKRTYSIPSPTKTPKEIN